jgi:hypothetical protein
VRRQLSQGPVGEGGISSSEAMNVRNDLFREFTLIALIGDSRTRQLAGALLEYATSVARQKRLFKGGEWDDLISQFMFAGHAELVPSQLPDTEPSSPAESGALADY